MMSLQDTGLSHSEIRGSKVICTSPRLFAAYHVLHRLREPRHPPCALIYFLSVCNIAAATDYTLGSCVLLLLGLYNMSKILFLN